MRSANLLVALMSGLLLLGAVTVSMLLPVGSTQEGPRPVDGEEGPSHAPAPPVNPMQSPETRINGRMFWPDGAPYDRGEIHLVKFDSEDDWGTIERIEPDRYAKPTSLKRTPITSRERQRALAEADAILEEAGI